MTGGVELRPKAIELRMDLYNPTADRVAISECVRFVKSRIKEAGAAEAWISAGKALAELKTYLKKVVPRGNNSRIGWLKAFELEEFTITRQTAEKLIDIHEFFLSAPKGAVRNLPASWKALHIITKKFSLSIVQQCLADGSISPFMTEREIGELARHLHLEKSKTALKRRPRLSKRYVAAMSTVSKHDRIAAIRKLMSDLSLTLKDLADA